jgi:hypothetical protein
MAYSDDTSPAGGRSYLEIFSLSEFYDSLQTYDDIVKPIQEKSVGTFSGMTLSVFSITVDF